MAGGRFDKLAGKVRPGTYINFESTRVGTVGLSERGIVVMPFIGHDYGPAKEFIHITNAAPDVESAKLGHSIYDDNTNMLLVREALKNASEVYIYIAAAAGTKATGTGGGVKGTARYGGSRGNKLAYAIAANPVSGFDITVTLDGATVNLYEGVATVADLVAKNDAYIEFEAASGSSTLAAVAGVTLTSGADGTSANNDVTTFLDAIEGVKFNALCFPSTLLNKGAIFWNGIAPPQRAKSSICARMSARA